LEELRWFVTKCYKYTWEHGNRHTCHFHRGELPFQYASGLFLIDIRQEEWLLVFEYVYYYKAEELGDVNQAKKFIERRIIQELSAEYSKSTDGGKNDIYEQLNEGFKYRFIFRNDNEDWGVHLDVKQNDLIRE
jgi:hypothetical protein